MRILGTGFGGVARILSYRGGSGGGFITKSQWRRTTRDSKAGAQILARRKMFFSSGAKIFFQKYRI